MQLCGLPTRRKAEFPLLLGSSSPFLSALLSGEEQIRAGADGCARGVCVWDAGCPQVSRGEWKGGGKPCSGWEQGRASLGQPGLHLLRAPERLPTG